MTCLDGWVSCVCWCACRLRTYGGASREAGQVEGLIGWDGDVAQGDGRATGLAGDGSSGRGEGARAASLEVDRASGDQRSTHAGGRDGRSNEAHGDGAYQ